MLACYYPKIVQFCPRKKCSKYLISNFNIVAFLKHFSSTSENIMMKNSIKTTKSILLSEKYFETIWNIDKRYKLRFLIDQFRNIFGRKFRTRVKIVKTNSAKKFFPLGTSLVMSFISFTVVFTLKKCFVWKSVCLFRQYSIDWILTVLVFLIGWYIQISYGANWWQ